MPDVFDAIADGVRREILERLHRGPLAVNDIAALFAISRPAISRHLRLLRECGLVNVETVGRERRCRLAVDRLSEVERWLAQFDSPWGQRFDALATEVARTKRDRRSTSPAPITHRKDSA